MENSNRRRFLKIGAGSVGSLFAFSTVSRALASACGVTPAQTSGPFYPGEQVFHPDNDLTLIPGASARAAGQIVYVRGRVVDPACRPVENATVEIWQACASGRYNNPTDTNPAPLDPNFKYWGEAYTNAQGEYAFKTVLPGAYPADATWTRPPHIHFKVTRLGFRELVTQMYFRGEPLNDRDLILLDIPASERSNVIVDFEPAPAGFEPGTHLGEFDMTLVPIG